MTCDNPPQGLRQHAAFPRRQRPVEAAAVSSSLPLHLAAGAVLLATTSCARVKPWQRERLATAAMVVPMAEATLAAGYRAKVLESKTGGGLPGVAPGGGCGCTQ